MARPIRNCERKKQVKVKKTSGVTYVYEKTVIYDPKKRYEVSFIRHGTDSL